MAGDTGGAVARQRDRRALLADLVLVEENPLQNLKVLYGTGHQSGLA